MSDNVLPARAVLEECVHAGTMAPSVYNSQPWRFRLRRGQVDVIADPVRRVHAIDPDGREMHISLGSAVLNVAVMMRAQGFHPAVQLLPDPVEPNLVARVEVGEARAPELSDLALVAAVPRRRTNRHPFENRPLHSTTVDMLVAAAGREGAIFEVLEDTDAHALLALVRTADHELRSDPVYRAALAHWTDDVPGRRDGVAPGSFGPLSMRGALPVRDFGAARPVVARAVEPYEASPTLAVLSTDGDTREDWLRAGMALERVLLEATIAGVSASFLTQPLEVTRLRRLYDERWPHTATQMIFRLGYARSDTPVSPRRSVAEVLMEGVR